jgi:hypothetical protein
MLKFILIITIFNIFSFCSRSAKVLSIHGIGSARDIGYFEHVQVAIESVLSCCTNDFFPVIMVGGNPAFIPNYLWRLHDHCLIEVFNHNMTFSQRIQNSTKYGSYANHGAFMRLDIPIAFNAIVTSIHHRCGNIANHSLSNDTGIHPNYVLYTDCDVIMYKSPPLIPTPHLALGPEVIKGQKINSGVMFINVRGFGKELPKLLDFADQHDWKFAAYDQGLLIQYFKDRLVLLPDKYNWKLYWGINKEAFIVHFHCGMKLNACSECFMVNRFDLHNKELQSDVRKCSKNIPLCEGDYLYCYHQTQVLYHISFLDQMISRSYYMSEYYRFKSQFDQRIETLL